MKKVKLFAAPKLNQIVYN